jgi:lipoyl(octanoyl) transferase
VDPRFGVTSLADLGHRVIMADVDRALGQAFEPIFGPIDLGMIQNSARS